MRRKLLIASFLFAITLASFGQSRTVEGTVISSDDQQPLPGVNVVVKGTSTGTSTDIDGRYRIEAPEGAVLQFSFIGFKPSEITLGTQTVVDVTLESDAATLEEVVVVGYGTVRKSDLTGSVASIKSDDLVKIPFASPTQALQGKLPGVQVVSNSGAPGDGSSVRIRGVSTTGNPNPLFIVDGVFLNNMDFLNSNDIQSIEVLKDASATAIYGSRGANGVIIVTTKRGTLGQTAPTISFNADYSIQHLSQRIDLLSGREFAQVVNEITPGTFNNIDAVPNTNWQDLVFQDAAVQNYQVSISGSSTSTQYYFGIGYFKQDGIVPKSDYERLTIKMNNTYHLAKFLRLGNNITLAPAKKTNAFGGAVFNAYRSQPTLRPYQTDGSFTPVPGVGNLLADIEYTNSFGNDLSGVGNFYVEADLAKGLTFKSSLGIDAAYNKGRSFSPIFFVSPLQANPINDLSKNWEERFSWIWENTVNLDREFGKHRVNAVIGYTAQEGTSEKLSLQGQNIIRENPDFWYFNANNVIGENTVNTPDNDINYSILSYLVRANYSYNNRYLLTATFRRDGSSKFQLKNRYANFPAFAVGWNVINERFMETIPTVSNLKLRASWGIVGNANIPYNRQYSRVLNGQSAVFGVAEDLYAGATYGVAGNPDLVWESVNQYDIGFELGLFNDALTAEVDYFHKTTKDILIDLAVPGYLGNGDNALITFNSGEALNKGVEFNLAYAGKAGPVDFRVGVNGTTLHNEMLRISGTEGPNDYIQYDQTRTYVGDQIGSFYGYKVIGVFQNQADLDSYPHLSQSEVGDLKFEDRNGDGQLNGFDRGNNGSYIPSFYYGFNGEATFKGLTLAFDFQGVSGNEILNYKETVRPDLYNFEKHVFDRFRPAAPSNTEPRASAGGINFLSSTRFIQDGSFLRLRSVSLSYGLPTAWANAAKMKNARVFVRGTNLFTWQKNTGYSPEVNNSNPVDAGVDRGTYPIPTVYTAGVNVTF